MARLVANTTPKQGQSGSRRGAGPKHPAAQHVGASALALIMPLVARECDIHPVMWVGTVAIWYCK